MKKIDKNDLIYKLLLVILCLLLIIISKGSNVFGSDTDWIRQHIIFPDYFRDLFYSNHNLFNTFSPHIGSGINIFYLSYYGLFSPIILLSYLLPFVGMGNYIIYSSYILIIITSLLIYKFFKSNDFNIHISFILSILFILSGPFIFHFHRHLMFINYMPFLILSLIGVKRYIDKNRSLLFIVSLFLLIMTSYYYAVVSIISIGLYYLYYYLKINKSFNIKATFKFIIRIILSILLASFFLLPTYYSIKTGRISTTIDINLKLFIPTIDGVNLLYNSYSIGLTFIFILSIIFNIIFLNKNNKIVSILIAILILFPIFNYILNGFLYLNGKCFIPLIPIILILIGDMFKNINKCFNYKLFSIIALLSVIFISNSDIYILTILDVIFSLLVIYLYFKKNNNNYLYIFVLLSFAIFISNNLNDNYITKDKYNELENIKNSNISKYINKDNNLYRFNNYTNTKDLINYSYSLNDYTTTLYSSTFNKTYIDAFYNDFMNNFEFRNKFMISSKYNIFFNKLMGVKYIISNRNIYGYEKIIKKDNLILYENNNVNQIGFFKSNIMSTNEYNNLSYNNKLEAIINNIIVDDYEYKKIDNYIQKDINLNYQIKEKDNLIINDHKIISNGLGHLVLDISNNDLKNKSLIIRITLNNANKCDLNDLSININGIKNKLTCLEWKYFNNNYTFDYILSSNKDLDSLNIYFSNGTFNIKDIKYYTIDNSFFDKDNNTYLTNIKNNLKNGKLEGNINCLDDGYFVFSFPYDKGYKIYVDDKLIDYELVDKAFIGFKLSKGKHNIKLEYKAIYFDLGLNISIITMLSLIVLVIYENKKKTK